MKVIAAETAVATDTAAPISAEDGIDAVPKVAKMTIAASVDFIILFINI